MRIVFIFFVIFTFLNSTEAKRDVDSILQRGTLRIAICSIETPPFFYDKKDSIYTRGIDIRLAEKLTRDLGLKIDWIVKPTFDKVVQALVDNEADIAISNLSVTLPRAARVNFSTPYIELKMAALVNPVSMENMNVISLNGESLNKSGVRIGFLSNSSYKDYALRQFSNTEKFEFDKWENVISALKENEIDVAFYDESNILTTVKTDPVISLRFNKVIFEDALDPIAIAIAPGKPELYLLMNQFINLKGYPVVLESAISEYVAYHNQNNQSTTDTVKPLSPVIFWICLSLAIVIWLFIIITRVKKNLGQHLRIVFDSLYNPVVIIMAMILGIVFGTVFRKTGIVIDSIGDIYFSILKMCSVPIMITAIIKSLGNVLSSALSRGIIRRFILLMLTIMLVSSVIGVIGGTIGQPGVLSAEKKASFGLQVQQSAGQIEKIDIHLLLRNLVPSNIMQAINEENTLGLLIISILMGIALGVIGIPADQKFQLFNTLFECFIQIINWSMYLLPFALFSLMAQQVTQSGIGFLGSMARLIIVFHVLCIFICMVMIFIASHRLSMSPLGVLRCFKNSLFVAFGTSSSFAAMPCAMNSFKKKTRVNGDLVDMLLPMGVTMFRPGTILTLSLGTVFMAQLTGISVLSDYRFLIIVFGAILAGLSAAGAPAAAELSALAIFLPMLGIPFHVTMVLLLGVNPVMDPIKTVTNILSNCTLTAMVNPKEDNCK